MASSSGDINSLTDTQQSSLEQLIAITAQEPGPAIELLRKCEWNVQIAIARFFDGEPVIDSVAQALAQRPEDVRRQETLMNGFSSTRTQSRDSNLEPAPRVVPQNDGQVTYQGNPLLGIIFMPVSIIYAVLSRAFRVFGYLFPFLPRLLARIRGTSQGSSPRHQAGGRIALKPRDAALRLIREIEEDYGSNEVPFFEDGYAQALDTAKRELKFLLVVLISPEHDDTQSFLRDTLFDLAVTNYIKDSANNVLVWAGTVQDAEAYQVSTALSCTKFPFSAVIVHTPSVSSTAMSVVQRIAGTMTARDYLSKIQRAVEQYSTGLTQTRRARDEQNAARSIRDQQNEAYERSLAQDRERVQRRKEEEQRRREEEERTQREEQQRRDYENNIRQWRQWRASTIPSEPPAEEKGVVRISLRMIDGARVIRRFPAVATMEDLYAFVECYDVLQDEESIDEKVSQPTNFEHEYKFRLVSPMPREVYVIEKGRTIKERIGGSGNLIVEKTVIEDSDEEE